MTRPFVYRPPNPMAKRAGVLLLFLAGLATLLGLLTVSLAYNLHLLYAQPEMAERLNEIKRQTGVTDFKPFILVYGVAILLYAAAAFLLGLIVRGGNFVVLIVTLVLASLMTLGLGLVGMAAMAYGSPIPLIAAGGHALLVYWLVLALRQSAPALAVAPQYRPMQDYYTPPTPPPARAV